MRYEKAGHQFFQLESPLAFVLLLLRQMFVLQSQGDEFYDLPIEVAQVSMYLLDCSCELLEFMCCCFIRYLVLEVFINPIYSPGRKSQAQMAHWRNQNFPRESNERQEVEDKAS